MRKAINRFLLLFLILHLSPLSSQAQVAVGKWRDCLDYSQVLHVAPAGDRIYAAAQSGLFYYDRTEDEVVRLNKVTGLNDIVVSTIAYDERSASLIVAYTNGNVDIVHNDRVYNLSDIKRSEIQGSKTIHHVRFHQGNAYLCCGFGVVVVDLSRYEIKETYYLGAGAAVTTVYDMAFVGDSVYAVTGEGLKRASASERHLGISDRWQSDSRLDSVTLTTLEVINNTLLLSGYTTDPDTVILYHLTTSGFVKWNEGVIRSMRAAENLVVLTHDAAVVRYDASLQRIDSLERYTWSTLDGYDAVPTADGCLWVGHSWDGLICIFPSGDDRTFKPDGPFSGDHAYRLMPFNNRMMLCPGGHTSIYTGSYITPNLLTYDGHSWSILDRSNGMLDTCRDVVDAVVNPFDTTETLIALWGYGVASIRDNKVQTIYNEGNTGGALNPYVVYQPIGGTVDTMRSLRTGAMAFDKQGNLWVTSSHQNITLAVRYADGSWRGFSTEGMIPTSQGIDKLIWDSITGYKWFAGNGNAIYVHDGTNHMAKVDPNNGSKLTTESVTALAQDQDGNIWVGTNKGIKVIYDGYHAFQNGGNGETAPVNCSNITITNGEFYEYLMAYESITSIAVDGANRKWVGTSGGGLYLLSANGLEQLEHFTASNSPLFSDKVVCVAVQPRSGEVYVGTDKGLQVYRGTATYASSEPQDHIHAFPNPVRPGYEGPIAIKGFTRNALIHIMDASGHTVFSTTAQGGQAIWNGRTLDGQKVASGVYYVFASDATGSKRSVAKILIVR